MTGELLEKKRIPVVLFAYNRADRVEACLRSLTNADGYENIDLYIFSDGWKNENDRKKVEAVQLFLEGFVKNEKKIKVVLEKASTNKGLANSVIYGVSKVIDEYGKVIVIEDDLVFSRLFLTYMAEALDFYADNEMIWSVSAYTPPIRIRNSYKNDVYLSYRGCSWGWATWKDRWKTVDWDVKDYDAFLADERRQKKFNLGGNDLTPMLIHQMEKKIDSWAVRWCYSQSNQDKYTVYPVHSLIFNNGADGSGTHKSVDPNINSGIWEWKPRLEDVSLDRRISRAFYGFYSDTLWKKVKRNMTIKDIKRLVSNKVHMD